MRVGWGRIKDSGEKVRVRVGKSGKLRGWLRVEWEKGEGLRVGWEKAEGFKGRGRVNCRVGKRVGKRIGSVKCRVRKG